MVAFSWLLGARYQQALTREANTLVHVSDQTTNAVKSIPSLSDGSKRPMVTLTAGGVCNGRTPFGEMVAPQTTANPVYDRVILGGRVMDPESGFDGVRNIGLRDGRIAAITVDAIAGRDTVNARGLVASPGFIDLHSHGTTPETYRFQSLDGVTTTLELELGTSDVDGWYRERSGGQRINYGVSVGHIKVRMAVMRDSGTFFPLDEGAYRASTRELTAKIAERIEIGLSQGAVDIGAGFPYTPAATREELLAVFRVAAASQTPIHVHITPGVGGLREVLGLAEETGAPLHVVHLNSSALSETPVMLEMIGEARARGNDVTTEAYPYAAGMTEIQSATIQDIYKSATDARFAEIEWPLTGERLTRKSFARYSGTGGPIVVHTNTEEMVVAAISSPLTIIASDAYWQNGTGHPRTTGTFSRVLGRYVRDTQSLSLMEAIHKMTLMPAQRLEARVPAMRQKGRLSVGADADITIFDPATVMDRSTYREPSLPPVGIQHVIVNGLSVVANGRAVEGVAPGKAVRAPIR
jgi:N-acyl-D-aspartate/D-glutamate deacylase